MFDHWTFTRLLCQTTWIFFDCEYFFFSPVQYHVSIVTNKKTFRSRITGTKQNEGAVVERSKFRLFLNNHCWGETVMLLFFDDTEMHWNCIVDGEQCWAVNSPPHMLSLELMMTQRMFAAAAGWNTKSPLAASTRYFLFASAPPATYFEITSIWPLPSLPLQNK